MKMIVSQNRCKFLLVAGAANLLIMAILLIVAANGNVEIKLNSGSLVAMAATIFDIALAFLFRIINQFSFIFASINISISMILGIMAVVIARTQRTARETGRLNISAANQ